MSDNPLSLQWPRLGVTVLVTLLREPPSSTALLVYSNLAGVVTAAHSVPSLGQPLPLCTCSQSGPKGLPTFVLSPVCSATFWNNRLQTFGLIFLSPSLMGRKVTFFSLDYIFSEE